MATGKFAAAKQASTFYNPKGRKNPTGQRQQESAQMGAARLFETG